MNSLNSVDFTLLKTVAKNELIRLFVDAGPGAKSLVIEEALIKPLDRLVGNSLLRQNEIAKIYKYETGKSIPSFGVDDCQLRFYLVRPTLENAKRIADHVNSCRSNQNPTKSTAIFWPRKLHTCLMVFEQQGIFGEISVEEFNPSLVPLFSDLLSLELPEFFCSTYLDGTFAWNHTVARSLWQLQSLYGPVQKIFGLGRSAEGICKLVEHLFFEHRESQAHPDQPFSHLFLVDRDVDYSSVFLSSLTYEALLDDVFGINCGFIEFGTEVTKNDKTSKVLLTDSDELYSLIMCKHFSYVFECLKSKAQQLQVNMDKRHEMDKVSELKKFVANDLRKLNDERRSLSLHIGASEVLVQKKSKANFQEHLTMEHNIVAGRDFKEVVNYVEDLMCQQMPKYSALSMLCLMSLTQNGLGSKEYQSLRKQFLQAYGHKYLYLFFQLKKLGILFEKQREATPLNAVVASVKTTQFQTLVKKMNLTPANQVNLKNPTDMSYVFNGAFTPIACQSIMNILQFGCNKEEMQKTLGVPVFVKESSSYLYSTDSASSRPADQRTLKTILVYFLGGVTYAEIAALRLLGKVKNYKIVIATTHIINKEKLFQTLADM